MRICALTCAALAAAVPAFAQQGTLGTKLLLGHPVYHESEQEAGVAMALSIAPEHGHATGLTEFCEELRIAARLGSETGDELRLDTIFVVPYKGMAVEGSYLPEDGNLAGRALVPGKGVARETLDAIVTRGGIPPSVLNETNVEHEISCSLDEPFWYVAWYDVRLIGDEDPDTVIERAYDRFMAIHQAVVEHNAKGQYLQKAQRTIPGG